MTTVITIKDATFTAPGLPLLSRVIRDGLVLGVRPSKTGDFSDFSDSKATFTTVGSPAKISQGMKVGAVDYLKSNVLEPASHTMIIGCRVPIQNAVSSIIQILGSLNREGNFAGAGIVLGKFAGSPEYLGIRGMLTTSTTARMSSGFRVLEQPFPEPPYPGKWIWFAVTVDQVEMKYKSWICTDGETLSPLTTYDLPPEALTRTRANLVIGSYSDMTLNSGWKVDIAESLVYNRVLTDSEIAAQFSDSKNYMAYYGARIGT